MLLSTQSDGDLVRQQNAVYWDHVIKRFYCNLDYEAINIRSQYTIISVKGLRSAVAIHYYLPRSFLTHMQAISAMLLLLAMKLTASALFISALAYHENAVAAVRSNVTDVSLRI